MKEVVTQLLDAHAGWIIVTDAEVNLPGPRILYVNACFSRLFGYRPDEVLGRTPRMFQGPLTDPAVRARLRAALIAGQPFVGNAINYRKDGSAFNLNWMISPLMHPDKGIYGFLAYQRDDSHPGIFREIAEGTVAARQVIESPPAIAGPQHPQDEYDGKRLFANRIDQVSADAGISAREREVLDLLLLGRTHSMIASALGIAVRTVRFHQESVLAKLGADSRTDLFRVLLLDARACGDRLAVGYSRPNIHSG